MAESPEHKRLITLGANWMKRNRFPVVYESIKVIGTQEQPDIIGFNSDSCMVIEVKVSRSDFFADLKKPFRTSNDNPLGTYRLYLTPEGMITPDELPPKWGLLYVNKRGSVVEVHTPSKPSRGQWYSANTLDYFKKQAADPANAAIGRSYEEDYSNFLFDSSPEIERSVLYSIARRQK